jgi:hypothetical protein
MTESRNRLLYPLSVAAALSIATFAGIGVAAITGNLSVSRGGFELFLPSAMADGQSPDAQAVASSEPLYTGLTRHKGAPPVPETKPFGYRPGQRFNHAKKSCVSCGVVQSIEPRSGDADSDGFGLTNAAATTPALNGKALRPAMVSAGYGPELPSGGESYVVRVRMEDGSFRTIYENQRPPFSIGERVKLINGSVESIG